jgi:6-bladed beta-propeller
MPLRDFCLGLITSVLCVLPAWSQSKWSFTIEQRYGDKPGTELANPQTIAVDGAGRLYVADSRPVAVKVFNPDGTLLRVIGRQGGGPGEYRNPWIAARGATLVIHDPAQSRTTAFDTSGKLLRDWPSFCCHQNEIAIDKELRVVVPSAAPAQTCQCSRCRTFVSISLVA